MKRSLEAIRTRFTFDSKESQIALTHGPSAHSPNEKIYDAIGSIYSYGEEKHVRDPKTLTIFNENLKDLYFYEVYQRVLNWSPVPLGRVRLMLRAPNSCYSMHYDDSLRYHLAIETNPECYFYFKSEGIYRIPDDGTLYKFDATQLHTAFNAGKTDRIHMVFDTLNS